MVFFTCNHCGDSVKKNKVEAHAVRCSRTISVSCMDCNKDFEGNTYTAHTQCITEQEKYSAKGFVPKPASNKGLAKQQAWCSIVNSVIASAQNLPKDDRTLLTIISKYDNIPRKKNKFQNFLKNGIFVGSQECIDRVWDMIQEKFAEMKSDEANTSVVSTASEGKEKAREVENTPPKKADSPEGKEVQKLSRKQKKSMAKQARYEKSLKEAANKPTPADTSVEMDSPAKKTKRGKKRKGDAITISNTSNKQNVGKENHNGDSFPSPDKKSKKDNFGFTVDTIGNTPSSKKLKKKQNNINSPVNKSPSPTKQGSVKFDWENTIVKALESSSNKQLTIKLLRKKVLNQYSAETGQPITDTIKAKFSKRLNRVPGVKALKGRAVLSSTA